LNIEVDGGRGMGLFEMLHDAASSDAFALTLKEAALRCYGAPFRAFLKLITQDKSAAMRAVRGARDSFIRQFVTAGSMGEVKRAAYRSH